MSREKVDFCIFLIHAIANRLGMLPPVVYMNLKENNIIDGYISPCYDVLHTMGEEALVDDITGLMREKGMLV